MRGAVLLRGQGPLFGGPRGGTPPTPQGITSTTLTLFGGVIFLISSGFSRGKMGYTKSRRFFWDLIYRVLVPKNGPKIGTGTT